MNPNYLSLEDKKITLIGAGTIGSNLAQILIRLGAGSLQNKPLVIVDNDSYEPENFTRHVLPFESFGKSKAIELVNYLRWLNPLLEITYEAKSVYNCDLNNTDFIIDATGEDWAIATNSNKPEYDGARLSITNSDLKANCPIAITTYINVIIEGCTLEGTTHGIVLRGANGIIKNNTITTTSTENDSYEYVDGYGSINTVSYGGIVVMANKQDNGGYSPVGNYTIEGNTITTAGNNPKYVAACGGSSVVTISGITKEEVKSKYSFENSFNKLIILIILFYNVLFYKLYHHNFWWAVKAEW